MLINKKQRQNEVVAGSQECHREISQGAGRKYKGALAWNSEGYVVLFRELLWISEIFRTCIMEAM